MRNVPSPEIALDATTWDVSAVKRQTAPRASLPRSVAQADLRSSLGPSGLLGLAANSCTDSLAEARDMLRSDFGMSVGRSRAAIQLGSYLADEFSPNEPLGYLSGVKASKAEGKRIREFLGGVTKADGVSPTKISFASVRRAWAKGDVSAIARRAATSHDMPTAAVAAALLAGMTDVNGSSTARLYDALTLSLTNPTPATPKDRNADRVICAAFALSTLRSQELDLGDRKWSIGNPKWHFRAAPWLLPTLDPLDNQAIYELLKTAVSA